jgi:hypothetical protein
MRASTKESLASAFVLTLSGAAYSKGAGGAGGGTGTGSAGGDAAGGTVLGSGPGWRRRMPSVSVPTSEHAVVPGIDAPL